jgi:hypothetical protein
VIGVPVAVSLGVASLIFIMMEGSPVLWYCITW